MTTAYLGRPLDRLLAPSARFENQSRLALAAERRMNSDRRSPKTFAIRSAASSVVTRLRGLVIVIAVHAIAGCHDSLGRR